MKWPRPAGEPDQTPDRRARDEVEETPSWLSSSDLASSPRPWERDDLVGLVESVATGEREIVAPPVPNSVDTPMYQQLRSERSEDLPLSPVTDVPEGELAPDRPSAPEVREARSERSAELERSQAGSAPPAHAVTSVAADPLRESTPGPVTPQVSDVDAEPAFHAEPPQSGDANAVADTSRSDEAPESHEVASYAAEEAPEGDDDTLVRNAPQEPSSHAVLGADASAPAPFHVEHAATDAPTDDPEDVSANSVRAALQRSVADPQDDTDDRDAARPLGDEVAAEVAAAQAAESLIGESTGPEDADPLLDVPTVPAAGASAATEALSGLEPDTRHATVICVANQKGGVGKTTTTVSLGAALAQEGAQVLVVDLDPQGNATTGLGLRAQEGSPSTYRVIVEQMDVEDASEPTAVKGLHVLPSSLDLAGAEIELVPAFSREMRLKNALDAVRDLYDVILIDCPPSLGLLTINAFVAADQVLVPIQCEYYALEGLGQLMRTVKLVSDSLNKELVLGGVVLTMFDGRTNLSQQVVDEVRAYFGETAYQTIVPRTVRLSEAPSYGQPIGVFDPSSRGARSYQRLAREVARRLGVTLESQDVSPLDRLLGTVSTGGPTGTGMAHEDEGGRDGALPTDLDEDLADLTEATTTPSSATAPGPDHV